MNIRLSLLRRKITAGKPVSKGDAPPLLLLPRAVSRRSFIASSSSAVFSPAVFAGKWDTPFRGTTRIVRAGSQIHFLLNDEVSFAIDPDRFQGASPDGSRPYTILRQSRSKDAVFLCNARLAGTYFRIDMRIDVIWDSSDPKFIMSFPHLGWRLNGRLGEWLSGTKPAAGNNARSTLILSVANLATLNLRASGRIGFDRNWRFFISDPSVAGIECLGADLSCDSVAIAVVPSAEERLTDVSSPLRTWVTVERGANYWPELLAVAMPDGAALSRADQGFDTIDIEVTDDGGRVTGAVMLRTAESGATWLFRPNSAIKSTNGAVASLRLRNVHQVIARDGRRNQVALIGSFIEAAQTITVGAFAIRLGEPADTPGFEILAEDGVRTSVNIAPRLVGLRLPLEGELIAASTVHGDDRLTIVYDREPCPQTDNSCAISVIRTDEASIHVPNWSTTVLRPHDMLHLNFLFRNFRLGTHADGEAALFPIMNHTTDPKLDPLLVVTFPSQHLAEQAVANCDWGRIVTLPMRAKPSLPSRLVFKIPERYATHGIPCRLEDFLDWRDFQMQVVNNAVPEIGAPPPLLPEDWKLTIPANAGSGSGWSPSELRMPGPAHTALALTNAALKNPEGEEDTNYWNLWLSPHDWSSWHHARRPVSLPLNAQAGAAQFTELWHTRLAPFVGGDLEPATGMVRPGRDDGLRSDLMTVRAIWVDGYIPGHPPPPYISARCSTNCATAQLDLPSYEDAIDIVALSADLRDTPTIRPSPRAIPYSRVMLSSQGATVLLDGRWKPEDFNNNHPGRSGPIVDEWLQDAIWGRDQRDRVSIKGYGLPTGHYISFVRERNREFRKGFLDPVTGQTAVENERYYCLVREPIVNYPLFPSDNVNVEGRRWPIVRAEISPLKTPYLRVPYDIVARRFDSDRPLAFWMIPHVPNSPDDCASPNGGCPQPFEFTITLTDVAKNQVSFQLPLLWVREDLARVGSARADDGTVKTAVDLAQKYCDGVILETCNLPEGSEHSVFDAALNRQKIAFAKEAPSRAQPTQDTATETDTLITNIELRDMNNSSQSTWPPNGPKNKWPDCWELAFYPAIRQAVVRFQSVAAISAGDQHSTVQFNDAYRASGFSSDSNQGELYLDFPNMAPAEAHPPAPSQFALPGASSGGLNAPVLTISHFSRIFGPLGGRTEQIAQAPDRPSSVPSANRTSPDAAPRTASPFLSGNFDPKLFFDDAAMLLGAAGLGDIVAAVDSVLDDFKKIPGLVQQVTDDVAGIASQITEVQNGVQKIVDTINTVSNFRKTLKDNVRGAILGALGNARALWLQIFPVQGDNLFEKHIAIWRQTLLETVANERAKITLNAALTQLGFNPTNPTDLQLQSAKALYDKTLDYAAAVEQNVKELITSDTWAREAQTLAGTFSDLLNDLTGPLLADFDALSNAFADAQKALADLTQLQTGLRDAMAQAQRFVATLSNDFVTTAMTSLQAELMRLPTFFDLPPHYSRNSIFELPPLGSSYQLGAVADIATGGALTLAQQVHQFLNGILSGTVSALPRDMRRNGGVRAVSPTPADILADYQQGLTTALTQVIGAGPTVDRRIHDYIMRQVVTIRDGINSEISVALQKLVTDFAGVLATISPVVQSILGDIVHTVTAANSEFHTALDALQALIDEVFDSLPQKLTVTYDWQPQLQNAEAFVASQGGAPASCTLHVDVTKSLTPAELTAPPAVNVSCVLTNFTINLIPSLPMIAVGFKSLSFTSANGAAPKVVAQIGRVTLSNDLSFVSQLQSVFDPNSGLYLDPEADKIIVGYRFQVPDLTLGALNIAQLSLDVGVTLPFVSGPTRARFAVSERDHPFLITAGIYGGGGFFAIEATPRAIVELEAALEFGGAAFVDIGVASGTASMMAGIYYMQGDGIATLTGFFDANGSFDVIGLIQINIDFYLGFAYQNIDGVSCAYGEVDISVEIGFTFFSIEVDIHATKTIAGGSSSSGAQTGALDAAAQLRGGRLYPMTAPGAGNRNAANHNLSSDDLRTWWKDRRIKAFGARR
jgi:hypothetical protein